MQSRPWSHRCVFLFETLYWWKVVDEGDIPIKARPGVNLVYCKRRDALISIELQNVFLLLY